MNADEAKVAKRIGAAVRATRRARDWTQEEVAASAGIARNYLAMLERGERSPSLGLIAKLCRILGADLAVLLGAAPAATTKENLARELFRSLPAEKQEDAIGMLLVLSGVRHSGATVARTTRAEVRSRPRLVRKRDAEG